MAASFLLFFKSRRRHRSAAPEKGTTAVEMALIAPAFFLFLIGTVEISLLLLTQHMLENAAYNTSRLASTGYSNSGQTQQQTINSILTAELQGLGNLIDVNKVSLTATAFANMGAVTPDGSGGTTGNGSAGQVVVYVISYPWQLYTPMLSAIIGTGGIVTLSTRIVVQNEPY